MSGDRGSHRDSRPQPRNLEGVLHMAVENTAAGSDNSNLQPITNERRQFLQGALRAVSGPSPIAHIKSILDSLSSYFLRNQANPASVDDEEASILLKRMEEMVEWCEDIDMACDFHKIGGYAIFDVVQSSGEDEFVWRCGDLIAALCQNNPYCQQKLLEDTNQLDTLMEIVESARETPVVRVKALYALSSFLRGNAAGQEKFVERDGYSLLLKAMQSEENSKLRTKATFLLMGIMKDNEVHKKDLTKMGCVEQLLTMLNRQHEQHHEHLTAALLELLTDNPAAVAEAAQSEFHLQEFLQDRMKLLANQPECEEELDYANQLQHMVFDQSSGNTVER